MSEYGGRQQAIPLPALPDRVWDALTNSAKLAVWYGENNLVPRAGHRFTLRPRPDLGGDRIDGEVVSADPPHRLVMRWSDGTLVTWSVEKAPGGSLLRISSSGPSAGTPPVAFDDRLRTFLRARRLPAGPVPAPDADAADGPNVARPAGAEGPDMARPPVEGVAGGPVAEGPAVASDIVRGFPVVPPPAAARGERNRRRLGWLGAAVAAVAVLVLVGWAVAPQTSPFTWGAPEEQGTEAFEGNPTEVASPGGTTQAATGSDASAGPGAGPGAGPNPSAPGTTEAGPGPTAGQTAPMTVMTAVADKGLLGFTVTVTVNNPAPVDQTWTNVAITFTDGVSLLVTTVDGSVSYQAVLGLACFRPTSAVRTVPAGASITFTFSVLNLLSGGTVSAALDQTACG
jgi:hypothetical protein